MAPEGFWKVWQETQAGVSRGRWGPLLSVFAVGVRCLCRAGLSGQPVKEKVAQGHKEKGVSQDLLKPWGRGQGFKSGKGTQNPGRGQGHFRWGWKLQGVPASGLSFNKRGLEPRLPGHSGVRAWASAKGTRPPASSAPTRLCGLRKATLPFCALFPFLPTPCHRKSAVRTEGLCPFLR